MDETIGDIEIKADDFILSEYDYYSENVSVKEKDGIKQFKYLAQAYTYYRLLSYGYLDYAKDVLQNPNKTVTYQMWLDSEAVQNVLTEQQKSTWKDVRKDINNHILYDGPTATDREVETILNSADFSYLNKEVVVKPGKT